jgi:hypothetical protein
VLVLGQTEFKMMDWVVAHKTMALANDRWVYPAMFDDTVVRETVKPTDWTLTSQKQASRAQVRSRGI